MKLIGLELEAVLDTPIDGPAPAAEPAVTPVEDAPAAEVVDTPAAPEPAWRDDPAFNDAVSERVAEEVRRLTVQQTPAVVPDQGEQVDWNEMMNPLSDQYDPVRFNQARDEWLLTEFEKRMDKRLAPVIDREEQAQNEAGQKAIDEFVQARWVPATDGPLTDQAKAGITALIPGFLAEANARYGQTDVAARHALTKATETIRDINRAARANGEQANTDALAAVAALAGEPGTNGAAHVVQPPAGSVDELFKRRFGQSLS